MKESENIQIVCAEGWLRASLVEHHFDSVDQKSDGSFILVIAETVADLAKSRFKIPIGKKVVICTRQARDMRRSFLREKRVVVISPGKWRDKDIEARVLAHFFLMRDNPLFGGIFCGATKMISDLMRDISVYKRFNDTVLVLGERGSGKELCARLLSESSRVTALNCSEFNEQLIESELFGYAADAFTGASSKGRKGLLEAAGNGTVFLDEIGEMKLEQQSKLLRTLEEKTVRPVGSNEWVKINARIILATNRDLEKACRDGLFKTDFYDRIKGFTLRIPPLRERAADLSILMKFFIEQFNKENNARLTMPNEEGVDLLFRYQWPGNARELRGVIRKTAMFTGYHGALDIDLLAQNVARLENAQVHRDDSMNEVSTIPFDASTDNWRDIQDRSWRYYSAELLRLHKDDKGAASRAAGISKSQFYAKLNEQKNDVHRGE